MRLCRVMDIRYAGYDVTGEVQRVREIVSAYTSNEAANSSLISYLGVQTDRLAELAASAREAEAQIARLQKRDSARQRAIAAYAERRSAELEQPTLAALLALRSRPLEVRARARRDPSPRAHFPARTHARLAPLARARA